MAPTGWDPPIPKVYAWIQKKSTKTETAAILALYHTIGDGERNPHVALAAVDRYQASICFDAIARMVRHSPSLAKKREVIDSRKRIIAPSVDGRLEALSADAEQKKSASDRHVKDLRFDLVDRHRTERQYQLVQDQESAYTQMFATNCSSAEPVRASAL